MKLRLTKRSGAILLAAAALLAAALVVATESSASNVYACVKKNGSARVYTKKPKCKRGEKRVTWNTRGPAGATGSAGVSGSTGSTGPGGAKGEGFTIGTYGALTVRTVGKEEETGSSTEPVEVVLSLEIELSKTAKVEVEKKIIAEVPAFSPVLSTTVTFIVPAGQKWEVQGAKSVKSSYLTL
jgi:hypothetical protein